MDSNKSIRALFMTLLCSGSLVLASLPVLTPENTEFMFDVHDVLVDKNEPHYSACKDKFISAVKTEIWQDTKQFNLDSLFKLIPTTIYLTTAYKGASAEAYYYFLLQYNKSECAEFIRDAARAYKPTDEMIALINTLHKMGFSLRAGSNIGNVFYNDLVKDHPQIFEHFQEGTTVEFTHKDGSFNWKMIKKPSHDFFKKHYDQYFADDCNKKYCVFVDDKLKNVEAANSFECKDGYYPFIAFHFDRSLPTVEESVAKLRVELSAYGIKI